MKRKIVLLALIPLVISGCSGNTKPRKKLTGIEAFFVSNNGERTQRLDLPWGSDLDDYYFEVIGSYNNGKQELIQAQSPENEDGYTYDIDDPDGYSKNPIDIGIYVFTFYYKDFTSSLRFDIYDDGSFHNGGTLDPVTVKYNQAEDVEYNITGAEGNIDTNTLRFYYSDEEDGRFEPYDITLLEPGSYYVYATYNLIGHTVNYKTSTTRLTVNKGILDPRIWHFETDPGSDTFTYVAEGDCLFDYNIIARVVDGNGHTMPDIGMPVDDAELIQLGMHDYQFVWEDPENLYEDFYGPVTVTFERFTFNDTALNIVVDDFNYQVALATPTIEFEYTGEEIELMVNEDFEEYYYIVIDSESTYKATMVGDYECKIRLRNTTFMTWYDGTTDDVIIYWSIKPLNHQIDASTIRFTKLGSSEEPFWGDSETEHLKYNESYKVEVFDYSIEENEGLITNGLTLSSYDSTGEFTVNGDIITITKPGSIGLNVQINGDSVYNPFDNTFFFDVPKAERYVPNGDIVISGRTYDGETPVEFECGYEKQFRVLGVSSFEGHLERYNSYTYENYNGGIESVGFGTPLKHDLNDTFIITIPEDAIYEELVIEIPAVLKADPDFASKAAVGKVPNFDDVANTLTYGLYPQTHVSDPDLIAAIEADGVPNSVQYYLYNGEYYKKETAHPDGTGCTFADGTSIVDGTDYWFKCEPITWKVITGEDETHYLLSEKVLDCQQFHSSTNNRQSNGQTIFPNNYQHSDLRYWLSNYFVTRAFVLDRVYVANTHVDNSWQTTNGSGFQCEDTDDLVFLPSYKDLLTTDYGFTDTKAQTATRQAKATDYARAMGVFYQGSSTFGNAYYWTRSPYSSSGGIDWVVSPGGELMTSGVSVTNSYYGVRPAITLEYWLD